MKNSKQISKSVRECPAIRKIVQAGSKKLIGELISEYQKYLSNHRNHLIRLLQEVRSVDDKLFLLPTGTRFYRQINDTVVFIIEVPPQVRTLSFQSRGEKKFPYLGVYTRKSITSFRLALPYVIFTAKCSIYPDDNYGLQRFFVNYTTSPLSNMEDRLYYCNLPNIYGNRVCQNYINACESPANLVEDAISTFWQSIFNCDGFENFIYMMTKDRRVKTLKNWAKASKDNPLFPLEVAWKTTGITVQDCLDKDENGKKLPLYSDALLPFNLWLQNICNTASRNALHDVSLFNMDNHVFKVIEEVFKKQ